MARSLILSMAGILWGAVAAGAWEQPFDASLTLDAFADPEVVRVADLDGDGKPDVAAAGADGVAWWRENVGVWTKTTVATPAASDLLTLDLDRDGDLDLATASAAGLTFHRNTAGDGSAWTPVTVQSAVNGVALVAGDFDRDGDLDLAAALAGSVEWWRNTAGDGSAWSRQNIVTLAGTSGVAAGDIDRDGDLDLAFSAGGASDVVGWLRNDLPGFTRFDLIPSLDGARAVRLADLDGDGFLDLGAVAGDSFTFWLNDRSPANGGWVVDATGGPTGLHVAEPGDVDRDGDLDLLLVGADRLAWRDNDRFSPFFVLHEVADLDLGRAVALGDLDRDGDLDLVAGVADDELSIYTNTSDHQSVAWRTRVDLVAPFDGGRAVDAGDLDRDGDMDIVAVAYAGGQVSWVEKTANGWSAHPISALTTAYGVALGDLDRDGDLDLLATSETANTVAWWRNDLPTGGSFARFNVTTSLVGARGVATGDLDRDGDLDVAACGTSDDVIVYLNNGTASAFNAVVLANAFNRPHSVAVADVDGDGAPDVLAAGHTQDRFAWWENVNGNAGTWSQHTLVDTPATDGAYSIRAADLDGDGDIDVLGTSDQSDRISFWENLAGDGLTWTDRTLGTLNQPQAAMAADLDRDGDLDVVGTGWKDGGRVAYFRNDGGTFTKLDIATAYDGAGSVVIADFDRDGLPDVGATAETADLLSVWSHAGGQYGLAATTLAASLPANTETGLFKLVLTPRGRPGEGDVELGAVALRLEEAVGDGATSSELAALIVEIEVLRDNPGGGVVGSLDGADFSLATFATLTPGLAGDLQLELPDGVANAAVAQGASGTFFVTIRTVASYSEVPLAGIRFSHLAQRSRVDDRAADVPLRPEWAADLATTTFPVNTLADLAVAVADSADPVNAGDPLTYTVTVTNQGPHTAAAPVLTLGLPPQTTLVATSGCQQDPGGVPACTLPAIASGGQASAQITVAVAGGASDSLAFLAEVDSPTFDPLVGDNNSGELTAVIARADLAIRLHADRSYGDGQPLALVAAVQNLGPGPALGAAVTVDLPTVLAGITFTCTATGGGSCTPSGGGGDLADTVDLPPGATLTYRFHGTVPAGTSAGLDASAAVAVGPVTTDAVLGNNADDHTWTWGNPIFINGFESGSLAAWSAHSP